MSLSRLHVFAIVFFLSLCLGLLGFSHFEGLTLFDALYLTVITMGTVGYGDLHPATQAGKIVAMCVVIGGVGSFVGVIEATAENVLALKDKKLRRQKRNMIRGVFFSDLGLALLRELARRDPDAGELGEKLAIDNAWTEEQFARKSKFLDKRVFRLDPDGLDLAALRELLQARSDLLLRILENPSIVEAEAFSDLLRAIYHLRDELACRPADLASLPQSDIRHLAIDAERVYGLLARQWLVYVRYLKQRYTYLFYLAVRQNPFTPHVSPVVTA